MKPQPFHMNVGTFAINWIEPDKNPVSVMDPGTYYSEIAFSMQTSMIKTWSDAKTHTYYIRIEHNGKKFQWGLTEEYIMLSQPQEVLNTIISQFQHSFAGDSDVPVQLIKKHLGSNEAPSILVDKMGNYSVGVPASIGTHNPFFKPSSNVPSFSFMSYSLPGVDEKVKHPVDGLEWTLRDAIMNLNDLHRWTREEIADWIETLDVDTTFRTE